MKKLDAFFVICGCLIAANCVAIFNDDDSESDEAILSNWDILWSDAARGLNSILEKDSDESRESDKADSNKQTDENNSNDGNVEPNEEDEKFSIDHIDSLIGGTLKKLERIGKKAVSEFMQSLSDIIDAFDEDNEDDKETSVNEDSTKPGIVDDSKKNEAAKNNPVATNEENREENNKQDVGKSNEANTAANEKLFENNLDKKVAEQHNGREVNKEKMEIIDNLDMTDSQYGQSDRSAAQITENENNIALENSGGTIIHHHMQNVDEEKGNEEKHENILNNENGSFEPKVQNNKEEDNDENNIETKPNIFDLENKSDLKEEASQNGDTKYIFS